MITSFLTLSGSKSASFANYHHEWFEWIITIRYSTLPRMRLLDDITACQGRLKSDIGSNHIHRHAGVVVRRSDHATVNRERSIRSTKFTGEKTQRFQAF